MTGPTAPGPTASGPAAAETARVPAGRRRRGYWIPGLIALAVLVAIGLAYGAGGLNHSSPTTLVGTQVAQDIAAGMQAQEGSHAPPEVHCPASEPVRTGLQFSCTVTQDGTSRAVRVVEINGRGALSWSLGR